MSNRIPLMIAALALTVTAGSVFAKGGAGGGGRMGGESGQHFSSQGMENSNGPNAQDRDKGRERAADRMNAEGQEHSRADQEQGKRKHHAAKSGQAR